MSVENPPSNCQHRQDLGGSGEPRAYTGILKLEYSVREGTDAKGLGSIIEQRE